MQRYLLPKPLFVKENDGVFLFQNPKLFCDACDARVQRAMEELRCMYGSDDGSLEGRVTISHGSSSKEDYSLIITGDGIQITAASAAGAFYGVQTLKQLLMQGNAIPCMEIHDRPEFSYRGFYHDVTRGRIPTLDTLKKLVDKAAFYKINSLQLYVEHSFAFAEYADINREQEPLTAEDIKELDAYCQERFIDLVPSLSCFGHLYALLQSGKYRHLCELEDYKPKRHLWQERMQHHTIDVSAPESFDLICSLIDQYLPLFHSPYFNICCDETFDLGKGKNAGRDEGRLYTGFVSKLIEYVEARGKTAMLWGDIVINHMELLPEISEKAILLNWDYAPEPDFSKIKCFEETGRTQIVCPGTSGWGRLAEYLPYAADNIRNMALYGKVCRSSGFLNTNWGDNGHLCDPLNAAYGMVLGAAESWNPGAAGEDYFDKAVGILNYHNSDGKAVKALKMINQSDDIDICSQTLNLYGEKRYEGYSFKKELYEWKDLLNRAKQCEKAKEILEQETAEGNIEPDTAKALTLAAEGYAVLLRGLASVCGCKEAFCETDFEGWQARFQENWAAQNRRDELPVALEVLNGFKDTIVAERGR